MNTSMIYIILTALVFAMIFLIFYKTENDILQEIIDQKNLKLNSIDFKLYNTLIKIKRQGTTEHKQLQLRKRISTQL